MAHKALRLVSAALEMAQMALISMVLNQTKMGGSDMTAKPRDVTNLNRFCGGFLIGKLGV